MKYICSQGGVKVPTGGILLKCILDVKQYSARERLAVCEGQQIWCESRADGYSPDGREQLLCVNTPFVGVLMFGDCALIQVKRKMTWIRNQF